MEMLKRFLKDESGLETVEYAIIAGLIVAASIVTIVAIGTWVSVQFNKLKTTMDANP